MKAGHQLDSPVDTPASLLVDRFPSLFCPRIRNKLRVKGEKYALCHVWLRGAEVRTIWYGGYGTSVICRSAITWAVILEYRPLLRHHCALA